MRLRIEGPHVTFGPSDVLIAPNRVKHISPLSKSIVQGFGLFWFTVFNSCPGTNTVSHCTCTPRRACGGTRIGAKMGESNHYTTVWCSTHHADTLLIHIRENSGLLRLTLVASAEVPVRDSLETAVTVERLSAVTNVTRGYGTARHGNTRRRTHICKTEEACGWTAEG